MLRIMPSSGKELSQFVQDEFENEQKQQAKLDDSTTSDRERETINNANSELKKLIISEEKLSRVLFKNIQKWFRHVQEQNERADAKEYEGGVRPLTSEGLREISGLLNLQ